VDLTNKKKGKEMPTKFVKITYLQDMSHTKQGTLVVEVPVEATEEQILGWYTEEGHEAHDQHEWVDLDDAENGDILDVKIEPAVITDRCAMTLAFQLREADNSEVAVVSTE
jgi:hypothetical protein